MPRTKREVPIERYTVMTMAEVGRALGVTPQRVSQIEKSALRKIRLAFLAAPAVPGLRRSRVAP
jgi:DNA-directed RNA polymerase sigma subunit (sigma70/sigma32)